MAKNKTITNQLLLKLSVSFFILVILMGASYVATTVFFTERHYKETSQKLNASLAQDLINEKFQNSSPFLEDGSINKPLFGDLMHDMMAVNRSIEVYLLSDLGEVLYSVVLDHSNPNEPTKKVDLAPINEFLEAKGNKFVCGDDPRNPDAPNIFSVAPFEIDGKSGYVYIILAGEELAAVTDALFSSYFMQLGLGAATLTTIFALLIGLLSIWFLTKNLRNIIQTVKRFEEGDLSIRIKNPEESDLSILATNFNTMADTIVANMDEIKSVDSLRRELIANVSHDLRTPLAVLKGYAETLQMKEGSLSDEERKKYLEIIHSNSDKLSNLVAQLFEYSKLEAEQVKPNKEPFSLTDLAQDLVANYQVLGEKKGVNLSLKVTNDVPLVFADISLVERALQNLMDNALKFTPKGGMVTLNLESSNNDVKITVSDTGPGIKESEQVQLFERYRQSKRTNNKEGVGLGLAIVKKIMELHNTTIQIVSKPNEGSSFQFWLPSYAG
ncbi:MAG: HAMP domain-containing histidine kinase [Flavobacteriales bacterium]|nr:HAMP domain-containing histidine kinase [Flavobacteriales bacterium]